MRSRKPNTLRLTGEGKLECGPHMNGGKALRSRAQRCPRHAVMSRLLPEDEEAFVLVDDVDEFVVAGLIPPP